MLHLLNLFGRLATSYRQFIVDVTACFDISEVSGVRCRVSGCKPVNGCGYAARIGIRKTVTVMKDRNRKTIDETSRATEHRATNKP